MPHPNSISDQPMTPTVSIVIPVYNRADMIHRALASALAQSFTDFEILLVDDGSTDGTLSVLRSYTDPRIRIIELAVNGGAACARNVGIRAARGEMVAFLDSDDEWLPTKLAEQVAAFENAPAGMDISCTDLYLHLLDDGKIVEKRHTVPTDWSEAMMAGCDLSPGSTLLARSTAFDRIGLLDETMRRFEDWDWLVRYTQQGGTIHLVPKILVRVYNRRGRLGRQVEESTRLFLTKHGATLGRLHPVVRQRVIADIWFQVVGTYWREGLRAHAMRTLLNAVCAFPSYSMVKVLRALKHRLVSTDHAK